MRLPIDGDIDQEGKMLLGPKADRLAVRAEQGGLTQATEVPSRLHRVSQ
jgi:hypothetical protein